MNTSLILLAFLGTTSEEVPMIVSYCAENQDRRSHLMSEQYANGLIHQEGQNIINYVTASQCIQ